MLRLDAQAFSQRQKLALRLGRLASRAPRAFEARTAAQRHRAGDTWIFDSAAASWSQLTTNGVPTLGLYSDVSMTYDAGRDRVLLIGDGTCGQTNAVGSIWELDPTTSTWTHRGAAQSLCDQVIAYDAARGRTVTTGLEGYSLVQCRSMELNGASGTWTLGPYLTSDAAFRAMTYDTRRNRVVLFGSTDFGGLGTSTFELQPAATPTWASYGAGCAGSAGTPDLNPAPNSLPAIGATFTLQLTNLPSTPGHAVVLTGLDVGTAAGAPLPFELDPIGLPGCRLWIDPLLTEVRAHNGAALTTSLAIPNVPGLAGLAVVHQAVVLDPAASNGLGAASNAGIATIF